MHRAALLIVGLLLILMGGLSLLPLPGASASNPPTPVTCGSISKPCPTPNQPIATTTTGTTSTATFTLITTQGSQTTTQITTTTGTAITAFNPSGGVSVPITSSYPTVTFQVTLSFVNSTDGINFTPITNEPFTMTANPGFSGSQTVISPSVLNPQTVTGKSDANGQYSFTATYGIGTISSCVSLQSGGEACGIPIATPPFWQGTVPRCVSGGVITAPCTFTVGIPSYNPSNPPSSVSIGPVNVGQTCNNACRLQNQSVLPFGTTQAGPILPFSMIAVGAFFIVLSRKRR